MTCLVTASGHAITDIAPLDSIRPGITFLPAQVQVPHPVVRLPTAKLQPQAGGSLTIQPTAGSQQCVCTTCQGAACASHFWLSGPDATCPYRPPVHSSPGVTTFYKFPGVTGQQPPVQNLEGGNWCRFQSAGTWVMGYLRSGSCNAANGQTSNTFDVFCPFLVTGCDNACNVMALVNPTTRTTCSCDYWCQLYGDCCGPTNNNAANQCPTMAPSLNFATTRSCPARTGLAAQQNACSTFRPAGEQLALLDVWGRAAMLLELGTQELFRIPVRAVGALASAPTATADPNDV